QFVAHLTTIMLAVIVGTAETLGITLDPDQPIHNVLPSSPAAS
ncbi:MAG: TetR/AcrR family transcriptional regulator, partial [Mycobacterium sp.]